MTVKNICELHDWNLLENVDKACPWPDSEYVLILLPEWSPKDVDIMNSIACEISKLQCPVFVVDIDKVQTQSNLERLVDGFPKVTQTPVLVRIIDHNIHEFAQGEEVQSWKATEPGIHGTGDDA